MRISYELASLILTFFYLLLLCVSDAPSLRCDFYIAFTDVANIIFARFLVC